MNECSLCLEERPHEHCPYCYDEGYWVEGETDEWTQVQCEWCYTTENSYFNVASGEPVRWRDDE